MDVLRLLSYWVAIIINSGQIIATSHDLTLKSSWGRKFPLFQGHPGWWNIMIWPLARVTQDVFSFIFCVFFGVKNWLWMVFFFLVKWTKKKQSCWCCWTGFEHPGVSSLGCWDVKPKPRMLMLAGEGAENSPLSIGNTWLPPWKLTNIPWKLMVGVDEMPF